MHICFELPFRSTWVHPRVFCGIRATHALVLWLYFVDRCLSFCTFSFDHCVVCSSSIYRFWLTLWYLQNPTQCLALFNLHKYIQNNLQVLNNVNIFKANDLPHRTYVTLTDLALLLIFIGIIILKIYVIIYCFTETKKGSQEDISYSDMPIIIFLLVIIFLAMVVACLTRYFQSRNVTCCYWNRQPIDNARQMGFYAWCRTGGKPWRLFQKKASFVLKFTSTILWTRAHIVPCY